MKPKNFPNRKEARRKEAVIRTEERAKRDNLDQLHILDKRLGKNKGATKERNRLNE